MDFEQLKTDWKSLSATEKNILGRPNFMCAPIARLLEARGFEGRKRAEDEQALTIYVTLQFYKEYGEEWADELMKLIKPTT